MAPASPPKCPPSETDTQPTSRLSGRLYRAVGAVLLVTFGLSLGLSYTGTFNTSAQNFLRRVTGFTVPAPPDLARDTLRPIPAPTFTLRTLPSHPSQQYPTYFGPSSDGTSPDSGSLTAQFQALLDLYEKRQGVDDNFTLRVFDNRTRELLELYTMTDVRAAYERGEPVDWRAIDRRRARLTEQLVDKYEARGIPNEAISVKWGRANQVQIAHQKDAPFVEYEMRLAQALDMSLLPIEIGTVETFNQDHLVSAVGARSRYQMMPFILRRNGIHRYWLQSAAGASIRVREELHPLLTMEPAFLLLRGYMNAVGHEIPGISAYHAGPGNIYKIYRFFLSNARAHLDANATVMDAYMWAVTEGYDYVAAHSSFGAYSRGYIPSAYGALRAIEDEIVDTTKTLRAARVQLKPGTQLTLQRLLDTLRAAPQGFDWGQHTAYRSYYERFRMMNPHIDLPPSPDGQVPDDGNVRFVSSVSGKAVQFFLPLGAPEVLADAGLDMIDPAATFRFDANTFAPPPPAEVTRWDQAYKDLVDDIAHFGFTARNRNRLLELHDVFERLAEERPTRYRQTQLKIIETHRRLWMSSPWEDLAHATTIAMGQVPLPAQPPAPLDTPAPRFATPGAPQ